MPRRFPLLVTNETYHIFNRGVEKRKVFSNSRDFQHFLETLEHYRRLNTKLSRMSRLALKKQADTILVEILCYCLMPNHFHLLLKQTSDNGISIFMNRVANSFTKYFNIKNERVGPLFQGTFKAVQIENDEQLLHVSRYIHLNPFVSNLVKKPEDYQWSSYPVYLSERQSTWLSTQEILFHFSSKESYKKFVLEQADYAKSLEKIKHFLLDS